VERLHLKVINTLNTSVKKTNLPSYLWALCFGGQPFVSISPLGSELMELNPTWSLVEHMIKEPEGTETITSNTSRETKTSCQAEVEAEDRLFTLGHVWC